MSTPLPSALREIRLLGIAGRIQLLVEEPQRHCTNTEPASTGRRP
ncbi:hypothetical protein [Streptomyces sp. NPDC001604]